MAKLTIKDTATTKDNLVTFLERQGDDNVWRKNTHILPYQDWRDVVQTMLSNGVDMSQFSFRVSTYLIEPVQHKEIIFEEVT